MLNSGYTYTSYLQHGGVTVLDFLCQTYTHSAREVWAARLAAGEVRVDARPVGGPELLQAGQVLTWQRPPWHEPDVPLAFTVLYEDSDLLAVAKPSGLPTMPGGGFLEHTLLMQVRRHWPTASPLHRLGRGTSGLVLFSLTPQAGARLLRDWREHRVRKVYLAIAQGHAEHSSYDICTPIGPVHHPKLGQLYAASAGGKPARSLAKVLKRLPAGKTPSKKISSERTLFEVEIFTGRPHQIRIHLASVGLPLADDPLYLPGGLPRPDALPGDLGYFLHAWKLTLTHPLGGQPLELLAPPPHYEGQSGS